MKILAKNNWKKLKELNIINNYIESSGMADLAKGNLSEL